MTMLNGKEITMQLGAIEEDDCGKWRNGIVTVEGKTIEVGGGWIHTEESAREANNCAGAQVDQHPNIHWPIATYPGEFEAYESADIGDLHELMNACGMDYKDENQRNQAVKLIKELSRKEANA